MSQPDNALGGFLENVEKHSNISGDSEIEVEVILERPQTKTGFYGKIFPYGFCGEFKQILKLALPIMFTALATNTISTFSIMFCGHLGALELAASGLANSIFNVTGLAVTYGLLSACDTLFAQTYGAGNKSGMSVQLQRGFFIIVLSCLPCWALHLLIEPILLASGQNPVISRLVGEYLIITIPALLSAAIYNLLSKFCQTQNIVIPPLIVGLIGNITNGVLHYLLLYHTSIGLAGSALAQSISYTLQVILIVGFIYFSGVCKETITGYTSEMWEDWGTWFKLAAPGLFMMGLQWWFFEIGTILTGMVGQAELAAQTVILSFDLLLYTLNPLGLGIAACIRVGQELGAGNSVGPRSTTSVCLVTFFIGAVVIAVLLVTLRWELPKIYNNDPDVMAYAAEIFPILAAFIIFDGITGVLGGVIRGSGMQIAGAMIVFFALYVIAGPIGLSLLLATDLKLVGLWIGFLVGITLAAISYSVVAANIDWEKQVRLARQRANVKKELKETDENGHHQNCKIGLMLLTRGGYVLTCVSLLIASICIKLLVNWYDIFGIYCIFENKTIAMHFTATDTGALATLVQATGCQPF